MSLQANGVLGIMTAEGTIVPILDFQTQRWNQTVFTTIADRQKRALLEFYYRERGSAHWVYLDSLPLERIPPAKAGEPDLNIETNVDARGDLSVALCDLESQKAFSFVLKAETLARNCQVIDKTTLPAAQPISPPRIQPPTSNRKRKGGGVMTLFLGTICFALVLFFLWNRFSAHTARGRMAARQDSASARAQETDSTPPPAALQASVIKPAETDTIGRAPGEGNDALNTAPSVSSASTVISLQDQPLPDEASWYQIHWGDTLWRISERFYGERRLFEELARSNRIPDPDQIIAGYKLYLPPIILGRKRVISAEELEASQNSIDTKRWGR